jgi:hypothetical protein
MTTASARNVVARFKLASGERALTQAVEKALVESGQNPRDAKRSGDDVAQAYLGAMLGLLREWAERVEDGKTPGKPAFRALNQTTVNDSYTDEPTYRSGDSEDPTYYSCKAEYSSTVQVAHKVRFSLESFQKEAPKHGTFDLSDHEVAQLLSNPDVLRAIPQLFEDVAPEFDKKCSGAIFDAVETFAYEKSETHMSSDDPDEAEVGVSAQLWITVDPLAEATWKVTVEGLVATFTATFNIDAEVLWPGDKNYHGYF